MVVVEANAVLLSRKGTDYEEEDNIWRIGYPHRDDSASQCRTDGSSDLRLSANFQRLCAFTSGAFSVLCFSLSWETDHDTP